MRSSRAPSLGALLALALLPALCAACGKNTEEWVADLRLPDPHTRELAAAALGRSPPDEALAALRTLLAHRKDPVPEVRERVERSIHVLAESSLDAWLGTEPFDPGGRAALTVFRAPVARRAAEVAPLLARRLAAEEGEHELAGALLESCGAEASEVLRSLLSDPRPAVRARVVSCLIAADPEGSLALPQLRAAIDDPAPEVREAARPVVARLALRRLRARSPERRVEGLAQLVSLGPPAVDLLINDLASEQTNRTRRALQALLLLAQRDGAAREGDAELFAAELRGSDLRSRLRATFGLACLGPQARPAAPALCATLVDENAALRALAALALGCAGPADPATRVSLQRRVREETDPVVRECAVWAIAAAGG